MQPWHLLIDHAADAATNMAVDETLLRTALERDRPLLRVYSWLRPAVSFGYFQKFPAHLSGQYEIVRRPTGGGLVYHGQDTTYTVVIPAKHPLYRLKTREAYCAIHRAVAAALDLQSQLVAAQSPAPRGQYECFQNPVTGDVVAAGQKLAGGAQRRSRTGVLHQGSIATRVSPNRLAAGFQQEFAADFTPYQLTDAEQEHAARLAREKYAMDRWRNS